MTPALTHRCPVCTRTTQAPGDAAVTCDTCGHGMVAYEVVVA